MRTSNLSSVHPTVLLNGLVYVTQIITVRRKVGFKIATECEHIVRANLGQSKEVVFVLKI